MALLEATIKLLTEDAVSSKHGQGCWLWLHLHLQACPDQCLFSKSFVFTLLIGMRASPPLPTLAVGTPLAPYNVDPTIRQLNSWPLVSPPEIQQDNTEQQKPQCLGWPGLNAGTSSLPLYSIHQNQVTQVQPTLKGTEIRPHFLTSKNHHTGGGQKHGDQMHLELG